MAFILLFLEDYEGAVSPTTTGYWNSPDAVDSM